MAVMGIMRHSIIFGGVNSADYGIYIGGEGTFDAPSREVEMVSVPGRNGAVAIDQGHWNNITVTYSAFNYEEDFDTFKQKLSDFRNAIYSKVGYQRLTDTFHPDEYRMAICVDPLDIKPINYTTASQFEIKFNCKPQRWLANGEAAIAVASGDTLYNPTQYDAGPLLAVEGYGTIGFNGYDIELADGEIGSVTLADSGTIATITIPTGILNTGDTITFGATAFNWSTKATSGWGFSKYTPGFYPKWSDNGDGTTECTTQEAMGVSRGYTTTIPAFTASYGTPMTKTNTTDISNDRVAAGNGSGQTGQVKATATQTIAYDGANTITYSYNVTVTTPAYATGTKDGMSHGAITAVSTLNVLGHPTYIDCEIGEAYKIENNEYISLNAYIALGSDLPILKSGANEISIDNTITELKVKPNWWKL